MEFSMQMDPALLLAQDNETPDQKRINHIKSEQRRRDAIKQSFQALCDSVPNLQSMERRSKSAMLDEATQYVKALQAEVLELERMLEQH